MRKLGLFILLGSLVLSIGSGLVNLDDLFNYANQEVPDYITLDNTDGNPIDDRMATLGRVLFYDTKLSLDEKTSCASCHQQSAAFGDLNQVSVGSFGLTGRHSMRLVNARFSAEPRFFWDERAATLEAQTTMPIQDHIEMGYSGEFGDPTIDALLEKLESIDYYNTLFEFAFGDITVTEERMQIALAQFVRSIQSFDSKYDEGRAQVQNEIMPFPNFTASENNGKRLFMGPIEFGSEGNRIGGGIACATCHTPPEFSINPNSRSNGVFLASNGFEVDEGVTRSPTLRDIFNAEGELNGPLMHNGLFFDMRSVLEHYNDIVESTGIPNPFIDPRLRNGADIQKLNMTEQEFEDVINFMKALSGSDVYTNEKWSNPFDENGNIDVFFESTNTIEVSNLELNIYPNPTTEIINISNLDKLENITIYNTKGQSMQSISINGASILEIDVTNYKSGPYILVGKGAGEQQMTVSQFIKM